MSKSGVKNQPSNTDDQRYSCVGVDECAAVGEFRNEPDAQTAQDIHGQGSIGKCDALAKGLSQAADHIPKDRTDEPPYPDY